VQGSKPERHISFLALRDDTMALAVSTDDLAATRLSRVGQQVRTQLPNEPVWLSVPGSAFRQPGLPSGMRLMLSALTSADRVILTLAPYSGGIEARMDARCRSKDDAGVLASQLRNTAGLIKEGMASGDHGIAKDDELAGALAAGTFDQTGTRVAGRWPVGKALIESLTAGI
jgi:hypothetical protein